MSRYIDADVLLRALAEMWYESQISVTGISVSELINKQPSIDIVRCAECEHWLNEHICTHWSGYYGTIETIADDFCSYGERSE